MKAAVPVVNSGIAEIDRAFEAVKQNLDGMTGQQKNLGKLLPLPSTATTADILARLNVILSRMQE